MTDHVRSEIGAAPAPRTDRVAESIAGSVPPSS